MMTTISLKVPADLAQKVEAAALRQKVSKSKIVREALASALRGKKAEPSLYDRMKSGFGCVDSGKKDLGTNPIHMRGYGKWRQNVNAGRI